VRAEHRHHLVGSCDIDLVDDDDETRPVETIRHPAIARAEGHRRIEHQALHVDVAGALERRRVHPLAEGRDRLVQTRCVDEDHLGAVPGEHPHHAVARRLGLVRDDGHLATAHRVHERRLPDVRSTEQPDESGSVLRSGRGHHTT
jgi:hypothetical protein